MRLKNSESYTIVHRERTASQSNLFNLRRVSEENKGKVVIVTFPYSLTVSDSTHICQHFDTIILIPIWYLKKFRGGWNKTFNFNTAVICEKWGYKDFEYRAGLEYVSTDYNGEELEHHRFIMLYQKYEEEKIIEEIKKKFKEAEYKANISVKSFSI